MTVSLQADGEDATLATVTYRMTALAPAMSTEIEEFAPGYRRFLHHWQRAIASAVATR